MLCLAPTYLWFGECPLRAVESSVCGLCRRYFTDCCLGPDPGASQHEFEALFRKRLRKGASEAVRYTVVIAKVEITPEKITSLYLPHRWCLFEENERTFSEPSL